MAVTAAPNPPGATVVFSAASEERFARILEESQTQQSALIPALHLAQEEWGWIRPEALEYVAARLELAPAVVYGVLSFYTMFHSKPVGRYHLDVCTSISCMLAKSRELLGDIAQRFGVPLEEVTPDGKFSLNETECLGACDMAPVVMVNNREYWERVSPENVAELLARLA